MCRLYGEPQAPEVGDYWRTPGGWAVYTFDGVVEARENEASEVDDTLVATSSRLREKYGDILATTR